jgi:hypothetical protein
LDLARERERREREREREREERERMMNPGLLFSALLAKTRLDVKKIEKTDWLRESRAWKRERRRKKY